MLQFLPDLSALFGLKSGQVPQKDKIASEGLFKLGSEVDGIVLGKNEGLELISVGDKIIKARSENQLPDGSFVKFRVIDTTPPIKIKLLSVLAGRERSENLAPNLKALMEVKSDVWQLNKNLSPIINLATPDIQNVSQSELKIVDTLNLLKALSVPEGKANSDIFKALQSLFNSTANKEIPVKNLLQNAINSLHEQFKNNISLNSDFNNQKFDTLKTMINNLLSESEQVFNQKNFTYNKLDVVRNFYHIENIITDIKNQVELYQNSNKLPDINKTLVTDNAIFQDADADILKNSGVILSDKNISAQKPEILINLNKNQVDVSKPNEQNNLLTQGDKFKAVSPQDHGANIQQTKENPVKILNPQIDIAADKNVIPDKNMVNPQKNQSVSDNALNFSESNKIITTAEKTGAAPASTGKITEIPLQAEANKLNLQNSDIKSQNKNISKTDSPLSQDKQISNVKNLAPDGNQNIDATKIVPNEAEELLNLKQQPNENVIPSDKSQPQKTDIPVNKELLPQAKLIVQDEGLVNPKPNNEAGAMNQAADKNVLQTQGKTDVNQNAMLNQSQHTTPDKTEAVQKNIDKNINTLQEQGVKPKGEEILAGSTKTSAFSEKAFYDIVDGFKALIKHADSLGAYQNQIRQEFDIPLYSFPFWFKDGGNGTITWWQDSEKGNKKGADKSQYNLFFDLNLEELGQIKIYVQKKNENIDVSLAANKDSISFLRRNLNTLRERLNSSGVSINNINTFSIFDEAPPDLKGTPFEPLNKKGYLSLVT